MITWDADLYLRFERERTLPVYDLIGRIDLHSPERIVDLGCGPGNSTTVLKKQWPQACIYGLDNSTSMLAEARQRDPAGTWVLEDLGSWTDREGVDLAFANASLQWARDHATVCRAILESVKAGGVFAFQMPALYDQPIAVPIYDEVRSAKWSKYGLADIHPHTVERPEFYYQTLSAASVRVEIWETTYFHLLDNHQAILTWYRSTGLRPFLSALPSDKVRADFEHDLLRRYEAGWDAQPDGRVLMPFRRLFVVAQKRP